jgi:hypothetical protein
MFEVFTNSIVYPKNILNYHNKRGGFVFLYILILVFLMSISAFVYYLSTKPEEVNFANSGCEIVDNSLSCTGNNYSPNQSFKIYDFDLYLLSPSDSVASINDMGDYALILQGSKLMVSVGQQSINSLNFLSSYEISTMAEVTSVLSFSIAFAGIFMGLLSNAFIILFIVMISSIPFLRFKSLISYKKIFKMLVFAATPMAFLFSIYNLLEFDMLIFFILMFFAYRSVFTLQKEIHFRVLARGNVAQNQSEQDETVEDDEDKEDEL